MAALFEPSPSTLGSEPEDPEDVVKPKPAIIEVSPSSEEDEPQPKSKPAVQTAKPSSNGSLRPEEIIKTNESDFDDSTTMILRRYTGERTRNGRPASFHLNSTLESLSLSETFKIGGKQYSVKLEEDCMSWSPVKSSKKKVAKQTLFLSDIFAVALEMPSPSHHHHHPHQTPPSPTSTRFSNTPDPTHFTVHALKSMAGSVGTLMKTTFRCPTSDSCLLWYEQIQHQMQNFGSRPRKLYVVVNPVSGDTRGAAERTWRRARAMFELAHIHTDVLVTQRRFHAREHIQTLDLAEYDGVIVVGGDGMFNEVLNGLMLQTQQQAGVNLRRTRFVPVTPYIRVGLIPTGFANSIARSVLKSKCPLVATAQIMLGCSTPVDITSISHNGQLLLFSAGPLSYGFWSDTAGHTQEFSWLGSRRFDAATIKTLLMRKSFEAEISFVPAEGGSENVEQNSDKCFNRCPKCSNFDTSLESPTSAHEKGASVMAAYSEPVDRVDDSQWQTLRGHFFSIMSCSHVCCSLQAPQGASPNAHMGNGCTDLIMVSKCSALRHVRWLLRQRKGRPQFGQPCVRMQRVKEFRFREILKPARHSTDQDDLVNSVENLVQEVDEDELTNRRATSTGREARGGVGMPMSSWNIDGDELPRADIDVRVHRHLLSVFARGLEPLTPGSRASSQTSLTGGDPTTDKEDVMLSP